MTQSLIIYVNSKGEASYVGYSGKKPSVGPLFSRIDGCLYFTAMMSAEEILALRKPVYQQLQLEGPKE